MARSSATYFVISVSGLIWLQPQHLQVLHQSLLCAAPSALIRLEKLSDPCPYGLGYYMSALRVCDVRKSVQRNPDGLLRSQPTILVQRFTTKPQFPLWLEYEKMSVAVSFVPNPASNLLQCPVRRRRVPAALPRKSLRQFRRASAL